MIPSDILRSILQWLLYVLLHIFVARHLEIFDYAFCFIYIGAVLFLPYELNLTALLLIAFGTGTIVDSFDNTLGMHIIATVLVAYLRPIIIKYQLGQKINEGRLVLILRELGFVSFLSYTLVLVSVHHTVLFLIEMGNLELWGYTFLKIVCSVIFTTSTLLLAQLFARSA
ncbi:MAG: hypothetical protein ACK4GN_07395 [Runella sp.]